MAADPSPDWVSSLPWAWGYGMTGGGRVFFINEEAKSTTWLHPVTGETVQTGHRKSPDLPTGWEEAFTFEGARYYINHNERKVTCKHPVTGQPSQDNCIFVVNDQPPSSMASPETKDRTMSVTSDNSNSTREPPANPTSPLSRSSRSSGKLHNFGKRSNSIKRNPSAPVIMRGWIYKKANSGMKLWKKRWFVLCDLCLFYYRDEKEEGVLGSILLPSFHISAVTPDDHINRGHAFKATHSNMRTYYFCTDSASERDAWMRVMRGAAMLQPEPAKRMNVSKGEEPAPEEANHVANHRLLIRPENNHALREGGGRGQAEKYGFQQDGPERPLTKITGAQPYIPHYATLAAHHRTNGPSLLAGHTPETDSRPPQRTLASHEDPGRTIQRTNSMLQLEQWIRAQREKGPEEESGGVLSYQTLPRNMPSYRAQMVPRYPEGYKTLPRNLKPRPDSVCSGVAAYGAEEKRRSIRDDTMWQLYEWQQRQFYNKQSTLRRHSSLTSPKQTPPPVPLSPSHGSISGYRAYRSELSSPVQRGDLTIERRAPPSKVLFPADRRSAPVALPVQPLNQQGLQGKTPEELTLLLIKLRRQQAELSSIREHTLTQLLHLQQSCSQKNEILSQHLQRNLLCVDDQMKDNEPLISRVHTMIENSALRPQLYQQMSQEDCRPTAYKHRPEEVDVDAKLSSLCEQDKVVQALEQKLQQLHKEKYTLEQALLSASQDIEMNREDPAAAQSLELQRDDLQSGLLSTCREVTRATAELERSWREYDKLERDVTGARKQMRDQLERLGEVQTEAAGIQRAQMQKEIWRIQDVMEGLSKHKHLRGATGTSDTDVFSGKSSAEEEELIPPRPPLPRSYDSTDPALPRSPADSSSSILCYSRGPIQLPEEKGHQRSGSHCGPDYRLYKSEPELSTVAEVDESNGDDKTDLDMDNATHKGSHFPIGVFPPRTKSPPMESTTIASYVTLRKSKKPEAKSERPRSAVEHLCITESPRPRMSLKEQMDRMRRHQAACLKEKRKGFSIPAFIDQPQSPSTIMAQPAQEDEKSPLSQEVTPPKDEGALVIKATPVLVEPPVIIDKKGDDDENLPGEFGVEDKEVCSGDMRLPDPHENRLQVVSSVMKHRSDMVQEAAREVERSAILFSYDFSADTLRRQNTTEGGTRSPLPDSGLPAPSPQLPEGSHFMCV